MVSAKRRNQKRGDIFRAAYTVFLEKGFEDASYKDISEKSNLRIATIQYYYPKKDDFLREVIDRLVACIRHSVSRVEGAEGSVRHQTALGLQLLYAYLIMVNSSLFAVDLAHSSPLRNETLIEIALSATRCSKLEGEKKQEFIDQYIMMFAGYLELFCAHRNLGLEVDCYKFADNQICALSKVMPGTIFEEDRKLTARDYFSKREVRSIMTGVQKIMLS